MKSFSCTALSKSRDGSDEHHNIPAKLLKGDAETSVSSIEKISSSSNFQMLLEIISCELGKPKQISSIEGLHPTKQWTALYYAVYHNRIAALSHYLRGGHSPDGIIDIGQPPLCIAAAAGHLEITKLLCSANANVNAAIKHNGETPLHIAIKYGRSDLTEALLQYRPDLNVRTLKTRETPLHYAAAKAGSLATVITLIKGGADIESLNAEGHSPAGVALQSHNIHAAVAIVSATRGNRAKLAKEKDMLLKHVEKAQHRFSINNELIGDIFEAGCPPGSTVLIEAIKRDDAGLVEMFLGKGADPNRASTSGLLPVFAALTCSDSKIMHALVGHKADVTLKDRSGNTVLQAAFESPLAHDRNAITELFEVLLSHGADSRVRYLDGSTLLHRAVVEGSGIPKIAHQLLQHGVDANQQDDKEGNTALHLAFQNRSCVAVLFKYGASASIANKEGLTPLLHATTTSTREKEPDLEQLVRASDTSLRDPTERTALHLAALNGLEKTVHLLLRARVDASATDSKKRTALLLAVLYQQWHLVPLLASQPGVNAWDEEGRTALHHLATSRPDTTSTWKDIASAASAFCEKGVSRTLREKSGATPLILAVKSLPEDGLPVVEALLSRKGPDKSNCVGHQDLDQHDALYYAATSCKPTFVLALLKNGSPFTLEDWVPSKGLVSLDSAAGKQVMKIMAEHEWLRRALMLQRQSAGGSALPALLPLDDLRLLLTMGLDPNSPPRSKITSPLIWSILTQTSQQTPLSSEYLHDVLKLLFASGADPNVVATRNLTRTYSQNSATSQHTPGLTIHPLAFLVEQSPAVDISLIHLFLTAGAKLSIPSTFFKGRYALHSAVLTNRLDIATLLLSHHADINCTDAHGRTPLHLSIAQNTAALTSALLNAGANPDLEDGAGNTALHVAAAKADEQTIIKLLHLGSKPSKLNAQGKTPRELVVSTLAPSNTNNPDASRIVIDLLTHAEHQERSCMASSTIIIPSTTTTVPATTSSSSSSSSSSSQPSATPPSSTPTSSPSPQPPASPELATPIRLSKQIVSIRYTPPTPTAPSAVEERGIGKRVDSRFTLNDDEKEKEKALPVLNRKHTSFDRKDEVEVQEVDDGEGDELASWLVVSGALDRL